MDILITDVTEMGSGTFCVAGWDAVQNRMVRPLPDGSNWSAELLERHSIAPGVTVGVVPKGAATGIFPHKTEDTAIDSTTINVRNGLFVNWLGADAPEISATLNEGFADNLDWNKIWDGVRQGVHTMPKTQCSSLVAVTVQRENLSFCEPFDKLKAILNDGDASYQLTVSSKMLKEAWRAVGCRR